MENYDLSTITRDQLHFLLNSAKDKVVIFARYNEEIEMIENFIEKEKKRFKSNKVSTVSKGIVLSVLFLLMISIASTFYLASFVFRDGLTSLILPIIVAFVIYLVFNHWINQEHQKKIAGYETELYELEKKEESAFNQFFAVIEPYKFPRDYWYEYAITQMLKYVENQRADNWKEVTGLYEEHLHRLTVEENTRITAIQSKLQAEYAREGRNAARWAAAGAWATAAGVWHNS